MKTTFVVSAAISGAVSFAVVRAIRKNNNRYYERKMALMDDWFDKNPHR